jgi:hypothetical protein
VPTIWEAAEWVCREKTNDKREPSHGNARSQKAEIKKDGLPAETTAARRIGAALRSGLQFVDENGGRFVGHRGRMSGMTTLCSYAFLSPLARRLCAPVCRSSKRYSARSTRTLSLPPRSATAPAAVAAKTVLAIVEGGSILMALALGLCRPVRVNAVDAVLRSLSPQTDTDRRFEVVVAADSEIEPAQPIFGVVESGTWSKIALPVKTMK